ncbi:MAG: hypothetical protein LWY06_12840 [Firmicutes bacterium]|nr:hypothetical protein [Bacillota bacterium]
MTNFMMNKKNLFKGLFTIILIACLCSQVYYLMSGRNILSCAQQMPGGGENNIRGGQSAPAPPGGNMQPPGQGGEPQPGGQGQPGQQTEPQPGTQPGQQMEPPPGGQPGEPGQPQPGGANGGLPGQNPGGRVISYPVLPKGRDLTTQDIQKLETYYILHRWVLSDLLWGVAELQKSTDHKLTPQQAAKILPAVKKLHDEAKVTEESNKLVKNLLTDKQNDYIKTKIADGLYMAQFLARYSPGEPEPFQGVNKTILTKSLQVLDKKIKESDKK